MRPLKIGITGVRGIVGETYLGSITRDRPHQVSNQPKLGLVFECRALRSAPPLHLARGDQTGARSTWVSRKAMTNYFPLTAEVICPLEALDSARTTEEHARKKLADDSPTA
jgi:hypothetical protein